MLKQGKQGCKKRSPLRFHCDHTYSYHNNSHHGFIHSIFISCTCVYHTLNLTVPHSSTMYIPDISQSKDTTTHQQTCLSFTCRCVKHGCGRLYAFFGTNVITYRILLVSEYGEQSRPLMNAIDEMYWTRRSQTKMDEQITLKVGKNQLFGNIGKCYKVNLGTF